MNIIHAAQAGQGGPVSIACINKATVDLGVPFDKLTATLQKCFDQHFLPIWGYPVKLYNTNAAKPTDWQFVYFDNADTANALGYHDLTKDGQPVAKIFVKTTLADKQLVSVTACHELFEMVIDPIANLWAEAADGTEYAYEMCDPIEEDTFLVDGIQARARDEIRSSGIAHQTVQHDQGRVCDHQEEGQSDPAIRFRSQEDALRAGGPARSSQRVPKRTQRARDKTGKDAEIPPVEMRGGRGDVRPARRRPAEHFRHRTTGIGLARRHARSLPRK
jgi:hypothetical protein